MPVNQAPFISLRFHGNVQNAQQVAVSPGGEGSARGPGCDVRSARRPQHPPRRGLKWGVQSAVGGRPSVSLPNFLRWAPHPPQPARPAAASLQAAGSTLGRPRRKLQQRSLRLRSPAVSRGLLQPPSHHAWLPGLPLFRCTRQGATGRAAVHPRGWPPPPPLWAAQPRRRGRARARTALARGPAALTATAEPAGPQAHCEDVPEAGTSGLQKK